MGKLVEDRRDQKKAIPITENKELSQNDWIKWIPDLWRHMNEWKNLSKNGGWAVLSPELQHGETQVESFRNHVGIKVYLNIFFFGGGGQSKKLRYFYSINELFDGHWMCNF